MGRYVQSGVTLPNESGSEEVVGVKLAAVPFDTVGDELLARSNDTVSDD